MVGDIENYCNILPIFPPQGNNFIGNILLPGYAQYINKSKVKNNNLNLKSKEQTQYFNLLKSIRN
jgi:hypothetical protein